MLFLVELDHVKSGLPLAPSGIWRHAIDPKGILPYRRMN